MSISKAQNVLQEIWNLYGTYAINEYGKINSYNTDVIEEFFFVILGGYGISYEHNMSGLQILKSRGLIESKLYRSDSEILKTALKIELEFNTSQFEPRKADGSLRKYRFVTTKPMVISAAGQWLWNECEWNLGGKLAGLDAYVARDWLCRCPGFGMKSASWFLRNTGMNNDCAVLDVHVMRFLRRFDLDFPDNLTTKAYLVLEDKLRTICDNIGASLGVMDYLLWILGRNGYLAHVHVR